jgi:hypothetical protein
MFGGFILELQHFIFDIIPRQICRMNMGHSCVLQHRNCNEVCDISSSPGGEYEAQNLLGCTAVFLTDCRPTFPRSVLPPPSPT